MSLAVSSSSGTFRLAAVSLPQGTLFFSHTKKKPCLFVLLIIFFVPLAVAESTLARKRKQKLEFFFAFLSLICTFGCRRRYSRSEMKKKNGFGCINGSINEHATGPLTTYIDP